MILKVCGCLNYHLNVDLWSLFLESLNWANYSEAQGSRPLISLLNRDVKGFGMHLVLNKQCIRNTLKSM